ncbi:hypothetical protein A6770_27625 [Nostoc minutum NIES-26]|uniref:Serine kinase n=1 Tax=Nostoc minutum NIES-26 TaxID=1844469 RepID=A0A367QMV4_9NOSO|nr:hypothetical protein A6770_27625 [Nostoc minutum NIES-26]
MKVYQAYNLCIASELLLPELIESQGNPDVIVRFGKVGDVTGVEFDRGSNFLGDLPGVGKFVIHKGCEVIVDTLPGVEEALLRNLVLGPILCVLLRQRGLLVLHASCVDINNKAVAFMGGSGWGKSTLAAAFHTQGYDTLTDDVMPVEIAAGCPTVFPAYPQFKLWPEAVASLGHNAESLSPVSQNSFKLAYKFPRRGFQQNPLPLHRIYVLSKGTNHEIASLQPQDAFIELVRHTRAMMAVTETGFVASHLRLCTELVKNVSFRRFTRKPALADLPELVKLVEHDLADSADTFTTVSSSL